MSRGAAAFAVVGAVNHGKSSVVSTLAEDDTVRVSRMPGETVEVQRFSLGELFVFYDTPGFQNAREALADLRAAGETADPLQAIRAFAERHRKDPAFDAECRLFEPVLQGAGLIYVVDGSRPVLDIHNAEMELLRLTGAPRLAIINRTGADDHVAAWKRRLGLHFNAVREFDAQRSGFAERIELLETLAGIEQAWKPQLLQAVALLQADREARLDDAAALITELVVECLAHQEKSPIAGSDPAERAAVGEALKARYIAAIGAREARAHAELIALFSHRLVQGAGGAEQLFADDLFSEATWQLFGLGTGQLMAAGTAAGAAVGASADAVTAGSTLLAGTAIGAALGAAGAFAVGKQRPELGVGLGDERMAGPLRSLLPARLRFSGDTLTVGPYKALNFPWILLDRALATLAYVVHRPHARRDRVTLDAPRLIERLRTERMAVSSWDERDRKACERAFGLVRRRSDEDVRPAIRSVVRAQLARIAQARLDLEAATPPEGPGPA